MTLFKPLHLAALKLMFVKYSCLFNYLNVFHECLIFKIFPENGILKLHHGWEFVPISLVIILIILGVIVAFQRQPAFTPGTKELFPFINYIKRCYIWGTEKHCIFPPPHPPTHTQSAVVSVLFPGILSSLLLLRHLNLSPLQTHLVAFHHLLTNLKVF